MIKIFDINYTLLSEKKSNELFCIRKQIFKDRLDWSVTCNNNMEYDEYDNKNATYILGIYSDQVISGLRFIDMKNNNMITGATFDSFFGKKEVIKENHLDASRLFIDKEKIKNLDLNTYPLSAMLFLAMINYAITFLYDGIYAVVSQPMLIIFKRSGWLIKVIEHGISEKKENVYLIHMPVDKKNQKILIDYVNRMNIKKNISKKNISNITDLYNWPLCFGI
ncbi:acyl-homoserine-lactone synthase [Candidatus Williamhamiltonella defendens]|nr:acyl-homoserine-lactone synthase [Candidatus Hamiltonella defensa]AYB48605.1 acyl-homoserine-lactone synthase [Candidatus Hamiltonella defensa]